MNEPTQPNEQGQPGVPARPVRRARPDKQPAKQDRTTIALLLVAAFVAVAGVGFAVGHLTAPGAAAANANGRTGGFAGRGAFGSLAPGQTLNPGAFAGRGLGSVAGRRQRHRPVDHQHLRYDSGGKWDHRDHQPRWDHHLSQRSSSQPQRRQGWIERDRPDRYERSSQSDS